jgi:sugar lactone lactonase YvrE
MGTAQARTSVMFAQSHPRNGVTSAPALDGVERPAVVVSVDVLAGDQSGPGRFRAPRGLALSADGSLYVVEGGNHRIQQVAQDGTSMGFVGGPGDDPGRLRSPSSVVVDADGSLLVANTGHASIVRLGLGGTEVARWSAAGGLSGELVAPTGIAVMADGAVYVSDLDARRIERYDRGGMLTGGWVTEQPSVSLAAAPDGTLWSAEREAIAGVKTVFLGRLRQYGANGDLLRTISSVTWPESVVVLPDGTLLVSDNGQFLDNPFAVRKLTPDGHEIGRFGGPGPGRPPGGFGRAHGIAALPDGRVVVADSALDCLQVFSPSAEPLVVWGSPKLLPAALRVDDTGTIDLFNDGDPRWHRIAPEGTRTVVATPSAYRPARQYGQLRAAFGPEGRAYVLMVATGEIACWSSSGEPEAQISLAGIGPSGANGADGLAVDAAGRLYVGQAGQGRIVRLTPDGKADITWTVADPVRRPGLLAASPSGPLYVVSTAPGGVDQYTLDGEFEGVAIPGQVDGRPMQASSIAAGLDGQVVAVDAGEKRLVVVRGGDRTVETVSASSLGLAASAQLGAVAFDSSGRILVAERTEGKIVRVSLG